MNSSACESRGDQPAHILFAKRPVTSACSMNIVSRNRLARLAALILAGAIAIAAAPARASGLIYSYIETVSSIGLDPLTGDRLGEGDPGIVLSLFTPQRLALHYRALHGVRTEQEDIARLSQVSDDRPFNFPYDGIDGWITIRFGLMPPLEPARYARLTAVHEQILPNPVGGPRKFAVCSESAFESARRRASAYKDEDADGGTWFAQWVMGQDIVFDNCSGQPGEPVAAPPDAPEWYRHERAYQRAASAFNRLDHETAAARFTGIAADETSPHQKLASYLVVRTWFRAMLGAPLGSEERRRYRDLGLAAYPAALDNYGERPDLLALRSWLTVYFDRATGLAEIERRLRQPVLDLSTEELQDLLDYGGFWPDVSEFGRWHLLLTGLPSTSSLFAFYYPTAKPIPREQRVSGALAEWRRTGDVIWLLPALTHLQISDKDWRKTLDEALAVDAGHPAYQTLAWNAAWLLTQAGERERARQVIEPLLARPNLRVPVRNMLLDIAVLLVSDYRSLANAGLREPLYIRNEAAYVLHRPAPPNAGLESSDTWPRRELHTAAPRVIAGALAGLVERSMPLEGMLRLAEQASSWPCDLRRDLWHAIWVRAFLLNRPREARRAARVLTVVDPVLSREFRAFADNPESRFAGAVLLLNLRSVGPIVHGDAFWAPYSAILGGPYWWQQEVMTFRRNKRAPSSAVTQAGEDCKDCSDVRPRPQPHPVWDAGRPVAEKELASIWAQGYPLDVIGGIVLDHVRAHPGDRRAAKALSGVVRASRIMTYETDVARDAFRLLHRRYGKTAAARRTPYWFDHYRVDPGE